MTFPLTTERLQSIAIDCVSKFMNKQASLSEAIAKEAQDLELNSDQTQRIIEASNTIAYLRQLEKSADRTFEFEVADYNKVMSCMCVPDDMRKEASSKEDKDEDRKKDEKDEDGDKDDKKERKDDGDHEYRGQDEDREHQEKKAMLMHGYFQARNQLTKMAYDKAEMHMTLSNSIAILRKDPYALEKLAMVTGDDNAENIASMCGLEKKAHADNLVFKDIELNTAANVLGLYKQATELLQKEEELKTFIKRAEAILFHKTANVEKLAGIIDGAAMGIGRIVGTAIGGATRKLGGMAHNTIKAPGAFSRASADRGFSSTKEGVKAYDKMVRNNGSAAAASAFKGTKPSVLFNRIGASGMLTALAGTSMSHKNNIKDL